MANRLQRIMAMDQMIQNRNMPQQGIQNVFNPTTGTFVSVPFQTDPNFKGRRTVMTPSGPQVLPGFEGVENPYRQLGRGVRNLLGNLFDRGSLRREERKAQKQVMEQADPMLDTMYPSVVERPEFEPVPDNQARIDELQERINRPIVTSQNLPTFDVSQVRAKSEKSQNDKKIEKFLPQGVTLENATREQLRTAALQSKQEYKPLADRYDKNTKDIIQIDDAFGRIRASATDPSPAGDLAIVFNFMKMLDPGSVVRESEFQTAAQAKAWLASTDAEGEYQIPNFVRTIIQQATEGTILLPEQRVDFIDRAARLYSPQLQKYEMVLKDFTNKANKLNVPVDLVITDYVQNRDYKEGLEELKKAANRQYGGEEMLFNFRSQSTKQLEEIANRSDRKKLVEVMGEDFVNALEAELIRRDEQK
tara:strand:+ start:2492 stop:3748 length:1257 start_codon:yes stop_codon:yes gene_type:complete